MKIFKFEQIGSTSDHALNLLATGAETAPFAVVSRAQTGGRGRSGKSWESPVGGLYLTLVIERLPPSQLSQLPICVSIAIAQWIWLQYKIRLTIKWPNDLLYAGAKLGGILCESSVQGNVWGPLLIGIGLNIKSAPTLSDQRTVCLEQLVPVDHDILNLAAELATYLSSQLVDPHLIEEFHRYGIEEGQIWKAEDGTLAATAGLDPAGHLQIRELATEALHTISSVRHDWRWIYQNPSASPLLVCDVGNTLCKVGIFAAADEKEPELFRFTLQGQTQSERDVLSTRIKSLGLPEAWPVHAIAVRDTLLDPLRSWLKSMGLRLQLVPKRPLKVDFSAYRFDEFGIDRLALSEAARSQFPGEHKLVISAGTAVTIEVIDASGHYLGGYILPGLQTKLSALHLRTGRLPLIQLTDIDPSAIVGAKLLGDDTRSAMLRGVLRETQLAIRGLSAALAEETGLAPWRIICTGGDGEFLSQLLNADYDPHLILKGIQTMVLGGTF